MNLTLAYHGQSRFISSGRGQVMRLAPNLARAPVAFDAALTQPLRFREAMSALHDVVISDLRFQRRDRTAWLEWKQQEAQHEAAIRRGEYQRARDEVLTRREEAVPHDLEASHRRALRRYWRARQQYGNYLRKHDPALWRQVMPCDPVVTVGDDVVFFECFSADESSYGCLTVDRRDGFGRADEMQPGTTNVDYSQDLYEHFQSLRSYRETRFRVDPSGFEVSTEQAEQIREEKIDLPAGWLRGFLQIQTAMTLPATKVALSRECVYGILAWLKRHKARESPRAIRFELIPGQPPRIVLEPWEREIVSHATRYDGPEPQTIRVWGRRRLLMLARVLPLAERFDVHLLGTGLPAFWVARMGEMRLTVGLSGWTVNDWTRGSALDLLLPPADINPGYIDQVAERIRSHGAADFDRLAAESLGSPAACAAALNHLARTGQIIHDLDAELYRWREVMPHALGAADIGPEDPESAAARQIVEQNAVTVNSEQMENDSRRRISGTVEKKAVEVVLDVDHRICGGKCGCTHHFRSGIRRGPCRHLLALRTVAQEGAAAAVAQSTAKWYERIRRLRQN